MPWRHRPFQSGGCHSVDVAETQRDTPPLTHTQGGEAAQGSPTRQSQLWQAAAAAAPDLPHTHKMYLTLAAEALY